MAPTDGPIAAQMLDNLNMGFTIIFTLELVTNFVAHRFRDFISNSWCASASPTTVGFVEGQPGGGCCAWRHRLIEYQPSVCFGARAVRARTQAR
jgi:hypothetical protein